MAVVLTRPAEATPAAVYAALNSLIAQLERGMPAPNYVTATKPAATSVPPGTIIFVSDGGAGAVFQGSTGSAWVNLG